MIWYQWLAIGSLAVCLISCLVHFTKLVKLGKPKDYSQPKGDLGSSVRYSLTGAMSPTKKESAYLHLPTYTAGLLYHLGTFLSLFLFILFLAGFYPEGLIQYILAGILVVTGLSGAGILIKRISKQQLRSLSNPDDYLSNLLVTLIQLLTAWAIINAQVLPLYFISISALLLYLPLGKLKHTIYFFAARYHLGFFYGWRGVWPPNKD